MVDDFGGYQSRHEHTLSVMHDAIARYASELIGWTFDFYIYTGDNPERAAPLGPDIPVLAYSTTGCSAANVKAIPDHIYGGWPEAGINSYAESTAAIAQAGLPAPTIDKIFWIGCVATHPSRQTLLDIGAQHPDDMHFVGMDWHATYTGRKQDTTKFVSLPDHCKYSMLIDIRGNGYSGRLKMLMHANRPVFIVKSPFSEFFHPGLRPYENYIPVRADMADLADLVAEVKSDPGAIACLSAGATDFAKNYLTYDAALQRWRDVLVTL
jgi:hypothetical protein